LEKLKKPLYLCQPYFKKLEDLFLINNRFSVDVIRNEVADKTNGIVHRLEPRLMRLLFLLVDQPGKVVRREFFLETIWGEYPGGNEGLNQGISSLRKLLDDDTKQIIQTVPKTGYCFNAIVSGDERIDSGKQKRYSKMTGIVGTIAIVIAVLLTYLLKIATPPKSIQNINTERDAAIARNDSLHQAKMMQEAREDAKRDSLNVIMR